MTGPAPSPDIELLRALSSRENYEAYRPFVKDYVLLPECLAIVEDFGAWLKAEPTKPAIEFEPYLAWARIHQHPSWKAPKWDIYKTIVENVAASPAPSPAIIDRFREMDYASRIRGHAEACLQKGGTVALDEIATLAEEYRAKVGAASVLVPEELALADMLDELVRKGGLEWRLEDLNRSIGPLHKGDLVLIGSRPEVGKTTFLTSEMTYMVPQLPEGKHGVIFNNEEVANKIRVRLIQSGLGAAVSDLLADPASLQAKHNTALGGRRIDVIHDTALSTRDVERVLRSGNYGVIGFNILDKINGFSKLEGVERLRALGVWARGLADKYGTVFALAQADASAEGMRVLNQSQIYGTKTGLVAESDAMIMIGKDNAPGTSERRFMNVVRNKMPGGPRTEPVNRHGVFEVEFDGARARYTSLAYRGHA